MFFFNVSKLGVYSGSGDVAGGGVSWTFEMGVDVLTNEE